MSGLRPDAPNADPELDAIATALYELRPDAFAAARDEAVRKAREDKKAALVRELGKLHRPTQSAWLVNLLWRRQRLQMEQLLALADELNAAQTGGSGQDLLRLMGRRRELEASLLQSAAPL